MVQSKDASLKFISKNHLNKLFEILDIRFGEEIDFDNVEVLSTEEVVIEPSLIRPDYVFKIDDVIFMLEFESSFVGTKKKKLFKLYIAAYDFKNNDENNKIIFFVISTKENSKMASYRINDWDSFNFPVVSLKELDKEKIINNIETKLNDNVEFEDKELLELGLTPLLEKDKDSIINQFHETAELMGKIQFPNEEIKCSVYGLVLMLSSVFFDDLDPVRKKIQGDLMGKVDCVREACLESYDEGISEGLSKGISEGKEGIARRMLLKKTYSLEEISEVTEMPLDEVIGLKRKMEE